MSYNVLSVWALEGNTLGMQGVGVKTHSFLQGLD